MNKNYQKAVQNMCHQCVASDKERGFIKEIEGCQGYSCPLYTVRPVKGKYRPVPAWRVPAMIGEIAILRLPEEQLELF